MRAKTIIDSLGRSAPPKSFEEHSRVLDLDGYNLL